MNRLPTPAMSGDYVLRAEIELDTSLLRIDGDVLEHFRASTLTSHGRLLLRGVTAGVAGPDEGGRYELRILDAEGSALILLPVPVDRPLRRGRRVRGERALRRVGQRCGGLTPGACV